MGLIRSGSHKATAALMHSPGTSVCQQRAEAGPITALLTLLSAITTTMTTSI